MPLATSTTLLGGSMRRVGSCLARRILTIPPGRSASRTCTAVVPAASLPIFTSSIAATPPRPTPCCTMPVLIRRLRRLGKKVQARHSDEGGGGSFGGIQRHLMMLRHQACCVLALIKDAERAFPDTAVFYDRAMQIFNGNGHTDSSCHIEILTMISYS